MTVSELIDLLLREDPDAVVCIPQWESLAWATVDSVEELDDGGVLLSPVEDRTPPGRADFDAAGLTFARQDRPRTRPAAGQAAVQIRQKAYFPPVDRVTSPLSTTQGGPRPRWSCASPPGVAGVQGDAGGPAASPGLPLDAPAPLRGWAQASKPPPRSPPPTSPPP